MGIEGVDLGVGAVRVGFVEEVEVEEDWMGGGRGSLMEECFRFDEVGTVDVEGFGAGAANLA